MSFEYSYGQTEMLLKCKISKGMFSSERICKFKIGKVEWSTCQSSSMCYRAWDMVLCKDLPEELAEYDGLAEIVRAASDGLTAYVRFWFAHDTEASPELDPEALKKNLVVRPKHTLRW